MLRKCSLFICLLAPTFAISQSQVAQKPVEQFGQAKPTVPSPAKSVHQSSEGERIFARNCARCHAAPQGFSPSISGTVVRHMRVRASLSAHDEQELLKFFNP